MSDTLKASIEKFLPVAYFKDEFIPFKDANVSIATHALHYGTAAFGGMRAIPTKDGIQLFRLDDHAKRLSNSAALLGYSISKDKIRTIVIDFVKKNSCKTPFYIRPLIYVSDLGVSPRLHNIEHDFLVYGLEMGDYLSPEGVSTCIASWTRGEDRSLPLRGKLAGTYVTSALAKTEAHERGFDEAILLNSQGKVAEASAMNVFIVRDGQLITPGVNQDILEGITRHSIITLAQDLGIKVIERPVDKSELLVADEVFLSGTAARITPVNKVEQFTLPTTRPITDKLTLAFADIFTKNNSKYDHWVTTVKTT